MDYQGCFKEAGALFFRGARGEHTEADRRGVLMSADAVGEERGGDP